MKPVLVMRFGAANNDIIIAGHTFDRGGLTTREQGGLRGHKFKTFRNMVVDALVKNGDVKERAHA